MASSLGDAGWGAGPPAACASAFSAAISAGALASSSWGGQGMPNAVNSPRILIFCTGEMVTDSRRKLA
ncbi:MAG: hypothetical protein V9H25_05070 [Candidatus Competibacter sp.]